MAIKIDELPKKISSTVYDDGVARIEITVFPPFGRVAFEGYIRGEFVPYSNSDNIYITAMMVNDELAKRSQTESKIERIKRILTECGVEIGEIYQTEIRTKPISHENLIGCAEALVDSGVVQSCDLSKYAPLSGHMCTYKLGINI